MKQSNMIKRVLAFALCLMLVPGAWVMAAGDGTLRFGDRGSEVRAMQSALGALEYRVTADGIFGEETLAAVKLFQRHSVIKEDGVAGPVTIERLYAKPAQGDGVLRPGSRGDEVRRMQNALKGLNYPAAADGIFGQDTLSALKAFQNAQQPDGGWSGGAEHAGPPLLRQCPGLRGRGRHGYHGSRRYPARQGAASALISLGCRQQEYTGQHPFGHQADSAVQRGGLDESDVRRQNRLCAHRVPALPFHA